MAELTREEEDLLLAEDAAETQWRPLVDLKDPDNPTPQRLAYESKADILGYGGSAGGGKTDLIAGLSLTQHKRTIIFRREHNQLSGIVERIIEIRRTQDGFNGQETRFALPGRLVRLGGMKNLGDEKAYQGRPFDLQAWDELPEFLEAQFRFLQTWNRSTDPRQRCRTVAAFNPPTSAGGEWVISFWAAWLDSQHPNPALPGELRWFISDEQGKDKEVADGSPVTVPWDTEPIVPKSRTFIFSNVDDNPYLKATGYKATLQSLPEPLRSQMLKGDFAAGRKDDAFQVVPTAWVEQAQARWTAEKPRGVPMTTMGVDVAMGGSNATVLTPRYDWYFGEAFSYPGKDTPDSPTTASLVVQHIRDGATANVDSDGVGAEVFGVLNTLGAKVERIKGGEPTEQRDVTGSMGFYNMRSMYWWRMREALDPARSMNIALPPSRKLKSDLCAPRWSLTPRGIKVETKLETIKRLGRSPDDGDSAVYALIAAKPRSKKINYGPTGVV